MRVVHKRCAGLDVHQKSITACVRVALKRKVVRETRVFGTATSELLEMADWLGQSGCTIVAMEADRSVLEAGVACARRSFRVGVGTTGPHQEHAGS